MGRIRGGDPVTQSKRQDDSRKSEGGKNQPDGACTQDIWQAGGQRQGEAIGKPPACAKGNPIACGQRPTTRRKAKAKVPADDQGNSQRRRSAQPKPCRDPRKPPDADGVASQRHRRYRPKMGTLQIKSRFKWQDEQAPHIKEARNGISQQSRPN